MISHILWQTKDDYHEETLHEGEETSHRWWQQRNSEMISHNQCPDGFFSSSSCRLWPFYLFPCTSKISSCFSQSLVNIKRSQTDHFHTKGWSRVLSCSSDELSAAELPVFSAGAAVWAARQLFPRRPTLRSFSSALLFRWRSSRLADFRAFLVKSPPAPRRRSLRLSQTQPLTFATLTGDLENDTN